jgi:peptidoglycan biosynthesis protein MviN/MurJ (putative lipid II flippase)
MKFVGVAHGGCYFFFALNASWLFSIRALLGQLLPLSVVVGVFVYPLVVLLYYRGKFATVDVAPVDVLKICLNAHCHTKA